jgi:hypothetical protein
VVLQYPCIKPHTVISDDCFDQLGIWPLKKDLGRVCLSMLEHIKQKFPNGLIEQDRVIITKGSVWFRGLNGHVESELLHLIRQLLESDADAGQVQRRWT